MSAGKLKPEFWWLSNIVKGCGQSEVISGSVVMFICCSAVLSVIFHFSGSEILNGEWWAILVTIFLIFCSLGSMCFNSVIECQFLFFIFFSSIILISVRCSGLLVIAAHKQNPSTNTFRVPWVPFVPGLSILFNVGLMVHLNALTWVRFLVWMTLGELICSKTITD